MTELAKIHAEDIKGGYVLHHFYLGRCEVKGDAWLWHDECTYTPDTGVPCQDNMVDLCVIPADGRARWITYTAGTVLEVEA